MKQGDSKMIGDGFKASFGSKRFQNHQMMTSSDGGKSPGGTTMVPWTTPLVVGCFPEILSIPSGKLLHNYGKLPLSLGKSTISMTIFNSKLLVYQRVSQKNVQYPMRSVLSLYST